MDARFSSLDMCSLLLSFALIGSLQLTSGQLLLSAAPQHEPDIRDLDALEGLLARTFRSSQGMSNTLPVVVIDEWWCGAMRGSKTATPSLRGCDLSRPFPPTG